MEGTSKWPNRPVARLEMGWCNIPQDPSSTKSKMDIDFHIVSIVGADERDGSSVYFVVRLFGRTADGRSVAGVVRDWSPHFFVLINVDRGETENSVKEIISRSAKGRKHDLTTAQGRDFVGYRASEDRFVRVSAPCLDDLYRIYATLTSSFAGTVTYEKRIDPVLCFARDIGLETGWLRGAGGRIIARRNTKCDVEVELDLCGLTALNGREWDRVAPFSIASFRLRKDDASRLTMASVSASVLGSTDIETHVWTLAEAGKSICEPGSSVYHLASETDLLRAWTSFLSDRNPDFVLGYDPHNRDCDILFARVDALGIRSTILGNLARDKSPTSFPELLRTGTFRSGPNVPEPRLTIPGRVLIDVCSLVRDETQLSHYGLDAVARLLLGEKETKTQPVSALPIRIAAKRMSLYRLIEISRATFLPLQFVHCSGQSARTKSHLHRVARELGYYLPDNAHVRLGVASMDSFFRVEQHHLKRKSSELGDEDDDSDVRVDHGDSYAGGLVLDPRPGFYHGSENAVILLDFKSMFPSIIVGYNLCPSNLVLNQSSSEEAGAAGLQVVAYRRSDDTTCPTIPFVQRGKAPLPVLLCRLAEKRAAVRQLIAKTDKDDPLLCIYEARQLALKVCMNAVYGVFGSPHNSLGSNVLGQVVAAKGRELLVQAQTLILDNYPFSDIVYGDTDSLFVRLNRKELSLDQQFRLGADIAEKVSLAFPEPIQLELQSVLSRLVLFDKKKKYLALEHTTANDPGSLLDRGLLNRNMTQALRSTLLGIAERLFALTDASQAEANAFAHAKEQLGCLVAGTTSLDALARTKTLGKDPRETESKKEQDYSSVARRMAERDKELGIGDDVSYVVIADAVGSRPEELLFAKEHGLGYDPRHYLSLFRNPLRQVLSAFRGPVEIDPVFQRAEAEAERLVMRLKKPTSGFVFRA